MVELKPFTEEHLSNTFLWMQDPTLRRLFLFQRNVTSESHREWFQKMKSDPSQKLYAITHEGRHIGNLGLKNIDMVQKKAETWIYIADGSIQRKGIASLAYRKLFAMLENEGKMNSLYCHIASFNSASIKLYTRLGFMQNSSFYERRDWNGEAFDLLQFYKLM